MQIEYLKFQNFFSVGDEPIEISFQNYGNIVLISGINKDIHGDIEKANNDNDKEHSNGAGKCFGKSTPILMYDGTSKMVEDIKVGDVVMGNDLAQRHVLSLARGHEEMYQIIPVNGDPYVVNKSHILALRLEGKPINISVENYLTQSESFKNNAKGYRIDVVFSDATNHRYLNKDVLTVGIKVEPLGVGEYYGFEVDGNNLFLLADFTVVHNSTISESLSYGLYGDFIRKKANHTNAINNTNKKGLLVEVVFGLNNTFYRVIRTRKNPGNELQLWESSTKTWNDQSEITQGGIPATQIEIDKILGLNHKAFSNIVCFGQHNSRTFLDCDAKDKREIADSLLTLDVFQVCAELTRNHTKEIKGTLKSLVAKYESFKTQEDRAKERLDSFKKQEEDWKQKHLSEISRLKIQNLELIKKLEDSDSNLLEIEKAQIEMKELEIKISEVSSKKQLLTGHLEEALSKINDIKVKRHSRNMSIVTLQSESKSYSKSILKIQSEVADLKSLTAGVQCDKCYSTVNPDNYQQLLSHKIDEIKGLESKVKGNEVRIQELYVENEKINDIAVKLKDITDKVSSKIKEMNELSVQCHQKISRLGNIESKAGSQDLIVEEKIKQIKSIIIEKEKEVVSGGPYVAIIEDAEKFLNEKSEESRTCKKDIADIEDLIPYYEWWTKGYTDGIRSFIISDILPELNKRITYWLDLLVNSKIKLSFDNQLEPLIERNPSDGNPFVYHTMSGGLRKRIDLAILQSFADVMMISSDTTPSLIFLDEIGNDFDILGKQQIYKMICEFAEHRQVFVITHDPILLDMLQGVDEFTVKLENGITKAVK